MLKPSAPPLRDIVASRLVSRPLVAGENVMRKVVHRDVDEMGRSHGHGTRKRAIASVWLKANPQVREYVFCR